jgi:transcription initiation factor TFIIF subunit alpha
VALLPPLYLGAATKHPCEDSNTVSTTLTTDTDGAMSAPPPGVSASTTPNNAPQPTIRRRKPTGPFAPKPSRTAAKRPPAPPPQKLTGATRPLAAATSTQTQPEPEDDPSTYNEFPLVTTKKALLEGLRFHAMKFISDSEVNPYDRSQFERPVKLHRRFPRDTPNQPVVPNPEDDKEREKEVIRKAEKAAEREATQAQIAPTDKAAAAKKRQPFKKKTEDVYFPTDTPEAQKRARLRYEEGRPWHLEDFENKNIWIGTYEEPLSESNAMFVLDNNGCFRMVPLEKWYRFNPTGRFKPLSLDEAEAHMAKKIKDPRWFGDNDKSGEARRAELERQAQMTRGRVGMRGENRVKDEDDDERIDVADDADELDFEAEDEFQDDDEGKLFGEADDEETKEAISKVKKERHEANIFAGDVKEDLDWDAEEEREKLQKREQKKKAKKLRKKLIKIEKNYEYDTDESDNPYSEEVTPDAPNHLPNSKLTILTERVGRLGGRAPTTRRRRAQEARRIKGEWRETRVANVNRRQHTLGSS